MRAGAYLAAIVESSDDAIIAKDLNGVIQSWNAAAERIFAYTAAEAIGQPITMMIPPSRQAEEVDILSRLRRGERIDHFETVRVARGGRLVAVSLTVSPIRNAGGTVVGASKVARDITDKKRAEDALAEQREHQTAGPARLGPPGHQPHAVGKAAPGAAERRPGHGHR